MANEFVRQYLSETAEIATRLDTDAIERMAVLLAEIRRRGGRVFLLGLGGGAGHASHAVNDFRKIAKMEAYAPSDNVSELTARANDDGFDTVYASWLMGSNLRFSDAVFVLSVGGGNTAKRISLNIVSALTYAQAVGATILGIVGNDGGFTKDTADACVVVPTVNPALMTAHTESFQAVIWHLLVFHPLLQTSPAKWESTK